MLILLRGGVYEELRTESSWLVELKGLKKMRMEESRLLKKRQMVDMLVGDGATSNVNFNSSNR